VSLDTSLTFIPDPLLAISRHTEHKFDLCILGNRVDGQPNAGLYMLERLRDVEDSTPIIVFSHEIDAAAKARVIELGGHFIDASSETAAADLSKEIAALLVPTQA
jgi:DNA-binding response OmpR family regulator